jgi:adenylate kinase
VPVDLVLFGIQGSGKGTQAKLLAEHFGYQIFEMGGVLRGIVASGSELGKTIASYIDKGNLVPHEIILDVLREGIDGRPPEAPILFDGVPRDLDQMGHFDMIMKEKGREFRCINVVVPEDVVLARLTKRALEQGRVDDANVEFVNRRIGWFKEKTVKVLDIYKSKNLVADVDGLGSVDEVFARMKKAVERMAA